MLGLKPLSSGPISSLPVGIKQEAQATLTCVATLSALGQIVGDSTLIAIASVLATAQVNRQGVAPLESTAKVTASAIVIHNASASLLCQSSVTEIATVIRHAHCDMQAVSTLSGNGNVSYSNSAFLSCKSTVTGNATILPFVPPQPFIPVFEEGRTLAGTYAIIGQVCWIEVKFIMGRYIYSEIKRKTKKICVTATVTTTKKASVRLKEHKHIAKAASFILTTHQHDHKMFEMKNLIRVPVQPRMESV